MSKRVLPCTLSTRSTGQNSLAMLQLEVGPRYERQVPLRVRCGSHGALSTAALLCSDLLRRRVDSSFPHDLLRRYLCRSEEDT
jgi:hypothetical protein